MQSSPEIDLFWRKIRSTVDELVACLEALDSDSLNWRPLDDANSLHVLATHTIYNVRHNLLNVLCGLPVTRDRDAEFTASGGSAVEIEARCNELKDQISDAIEALPPAELDRERHHRPLSTACQDTNQAYRREAGSGRRLRPEHRVYDSQLLPGAASGGLDALPGADRHQLHPLGLPPFRSSDLTPFPTSPNDTTVLFALAAKWAAARGDGRTVLAKTTAPRKHRTLPLAIGPNDAFRASRRPRTDLPRGHRCHRRRRAGTHQPRPACRSARYRQRRRSASLVDRTRSTESRWPPSRRAGTGRARVAPSVPPSDASASQTRNEPTASVEEAGTCRIGRQRHRSSSPASSVAASFSRDVVELLIPLSGAALTRMLAGRPSATSITISSARGGSPVRSAVHRNIPCGDLRVISISPLPPRSGGRCRRQRGAPGAPSPDSGSSPPSLRDTATDREGRSSGTYAQVPCGEGQSRLPTTYFFDISSLP